MNLCLFEDHRVTDSFPITYTRPVFDMRCGIFSLREKIEHHLTGNQLIYHVRESLSTVVREQYPDVLVNTLPEEDTLFLNGRVLFNEFYELDPRKDQPVGYYHGDTLVAAFIPGNTITQLETEGQYGLLSFAGILFTETHHVDWKVLRYPWEFIQANPGEIEADIRRHSSLQPVDSGDYDHSYVLEPQKIYLGENVTIKPSGVLDASPGPIVIDDDVVIGHNSTIVGPCYIGRGSKISAVANIKGKVSIGPMCKVGGEVGDVIIQGYSNKKHEGFLGGAYLGEWVNLGASTNNSDLKNNYSMVSVPVNGELIDTGMQFYGCILGDHTKTAIGTKINTGSSFGIGCNIFGAGFPPKFIPSFSWGGSEKLVEYDFARMLDTAEKVMNRRNKELSGYYRTMLETIYSMTHRERENYLQTQSM